MALERLRPGGATVRRSVRSARRQTVRARWICAAAGVPPGRMNWTSGASSVSSESIAVSSCSTCRSVTALWNGPFGRNVRQGGSDDEQVVLELRDQPVGGWVQNQRPCHPQRGIELVDCSVGVNPRVVLGHATTSEQPRHPIIASLGIDAHGRFSSFPLPIGDPVVSPYTRRVGVK